MWCCFFLLLKILSFLVLRDCQASFFQFFPVFLALLPSLPSHLEIVLRALLVPSFLSSHALGSSTLKASFITLMLIAPESAFPAVFFLTWVPISCVHLSTWFFPLVALLSKATGPKLIFSSQFFHFTCSLTNILRSISWVHLGFLLFLQIQIQPLVSVTTFS